MTPPELRAFFPEIGGQVQLASSGEYAVPTLRYLQDVFYPAFRQRMWPLTGWTDRWECWQITNFYLAELARHFAESQGFPAGSKAIAALRWDFHPDAGKIPNANPLEGHSIACLITDKGRTCIDPQNNLVWADSRIEWLSTRRLCD